MAAKTKKPVTDGRMVGALKLVQRLEAPGTKKIPLSSITFNALTDGGLPDGGFVEFWGKSGSGKSTLALDAVKCFLQNGDPRDVLWVDVEQSFDWRWGKKCGIPFEAYDVPVDAEHPDGKEAVCEGFYQTRPDAGLPGEDILRGVHTAAASNEFKLIVIDSIAGIVPGGVMKKDIGERTIAQLPMLLSDFLPRIVPYLIQNHILMIFINQSRDNIGAYGAGGAHSPGGNVLAHYRLMSAQFKRGNYYKPDFGEIIATADQNKAAGFFTNIVMARNKTNDNGGVLLGQIAIALNSGIDKNAEMLSYLRAFDIVKGAGKKYFAGVVDENGELIPFKSKAEVEAFVIENPEYFELVCKGTIKDEEAETVFCETPAFIKSASMEELQAMETEEAELPGESFVSVEDKLNQVLGNSEEYGY